MEKIKKCSKNNHYPEWDDNEIIFMDENEISVQCNCYCLTKAYQRDYIFHAEEEVTDE